MKHFFASLLLAIAVTHCGWDQPDPAAYTPSPDYPCGVRGIPCFSEAGVFDHTCCPEQFTCGGGKWSVGCPADACCFIGPPSEELKRASDGGAPRRLVR